MSSSTLVLKYIGPCVHTGITVNDTSSFVRFACFSYCFLIVSVPVWCRAALCAQVWRALTSLVGFIIVWYTTVLSFRGLASSRFSLHLHELGKVRYFDALTALCSG